MQQISGKKQLKLSRIITALLALIARCLPGFGKQYLYIWFGELCVGGDWRYFFGCGLLTLFWKRYHGKAVLVTIVTGLTFTIIWINTGMEEVISSRLLTFFVALITAIIVTLAWPEKHHVKN